MQTDANGHGIVNILAADKLLQSPKVYATLLLWMLSELFEKLPEVGDPDKPKLVFFFDEAHLLFTDLPSMLQEKVEQVVRLIRSKGVGVYFVTQNPMDVPEIILGQLVHTARPESGESGCSNVPCESETECRESHYRVGRGRSAGVFSR
jgi:uncharacterized protein